MSERINIHDNRSTIRWKLLTSASALALTAYVSTAGLARAEDTDRPLLWIELGGQLEGLSSQQEAFAPSFLSGISQYGIKSPLGLERAPRFGFASDGTITFEPDDSNWVFSGSIHYGRSAKNKNSHQQTPNAHLPDHVTLPPSFGSKYINAGTRYPSSHVKFADAAARQSERHVVLDFQAGKDVGLGMFGGGSSVLSAGIRFAQFSSKSKVTMHMEPDVQYPTIPITGTFATWSRKRLAFYSGAFHFHDDAAMETNQRSFHGVGPSLAWKASAPFVGNADSGELTFDWGANAAVLFGRQRVRGHHQTTVRSYYKHGSFADGKHKGGFIEHAFATISTVLHKQSAPFERTRTVAVPNVGGFAGISYRYADAKLSFGYRADFFFGAIDGGIGTRKDENRGFYGPFASISFGLGD
ncbi:MAG TPA: hypothetical protein VGT78_06650 [Rhizomicrobium sp.]|nr:hypothetical protein [Rhizomicrobium sp.]